MANLKRFSYYFKSYIIPDLEDINIFTLSLKKPNVEY